MKHQAWTRRLIVKKSVELPKKYCTCTVPVRAVFVDAYELDYRYTSRLLFRGCFRFNCLRIMLFVLSGCILSKLSKDDGQNSYIWPKVRLSRLPTGHIFSLPLLCYFLKIMHVSALKSTMRRTLRVTRPKWILYSINTILVAQYVQSEAQNCTAYVTQIQSSSKTHRRKK